MNRSSKRGLQKKTIMKEERKNEINEISLNSPLGKALFKAKIGTSTSYFVGNSEIFITILEKLNN